MAKIIFNAPQALRKNALLAVLAWTAFSSPNVLASGPDQVQGQLTITVSDYFKENRSTTQYFVRDQAGVSHELLFVKEPAGLRTGMIVTAQGNANGSRLENAEVSASSNFGGDGLQSLSQKPQSLVTILPTAVQGDQTTLVYMLEAAGSQPNFTSAQVQQYVFSATDPNSVTNYYQRFSATSPTGPVSFSGDVVGPFVISNVTTCDNIGLAAQADQEATAAGVDISKYAHHLYMIPPELKSVCVWAGLSTIGGQPSYSWMNSGAAEPGSNFTYVVLSHELGHAMKLQHSQAISAQGSLIEYGDNSCTMGDMTDYLVGLDAPHLIQLGWLPASNVQVASSSGSYQIDAVENPSTQAQALEFFPLVSMETSTSPIVNHSWVLRIHLCLPHLLAGCRFIIGRDSTAKASLLHTLSAEASQTVKPLRVPTIAWP